MDPHCCFTFEKIMQGDLAKVEKFPIKVKIQSTKDNARVTRGDVSDKIVENRKTTLNLNLCISDAISLWNMAPQKIRSATTLSEAKREIKSFVGRPFCFHSPSVG